MADHYKLYRPLMGSGYLANLSNTQVRIKPWNTKRLGP